MPETRITVPLSAGVGAALSYYLLFPPLRSGLIGTSLFLLALFVPVLALCLSRVLLSPPLNARPPGLPRNLRALLAAFCAGLALGTGSAAQVLPAPVFGQPADRVSGISGRLLDDPRLLDSGSAMTRIALTAASGPDGLRTTAKGELTVFFREENSAVLRDAGRGTEVFVEGSLTTGRDLPAFSATSLHVTAEAGRLERFRTGMRSGLIDRFAGAEGESPAWSGLALALLLGIRDNLDSGLTSLYRGAGISYILALSGMHLAVIIALLSLLLKKPMGLRAATVAGMLIIVAYCLLVGPLPSLYRSALMYLLGAFAVLGMLRRDSLSILTMAFVLQLALDPQSGLSLSFILSYLAMVGILVLGKALNDLLAGLIPRFFLGPLSLSLGAFIGTAAAVLWFFGELRPVGILAGLIVAPLTTAFMVLALAWLCIPPLAVPIAALLALLYDAMESTARLAAHVPNLSAPPALAIPLSLALLIFLPALAAFLRRRRNRLDPFD